MEEMVITGKENGLEESSPHKESLMRVVLALLLLTICVVIGLWDIYCAARGRPIDTVSSIMQDWVRQHSMLGIIIGSVIGHIFWPTWITR